VSRWTCKTRPTWTWWLKPFCTGLGAAGNNSCMRVLQCKKLACNAFARRRWVKSLDHIHICVLGCAFHIRWCLAWLGSASVHNLGVVLGRHQGVVWFARGCKRCAALGMHGLPVDDEAHLLFSCPATAVVRRERRFAQLPFPSLQDLMCCRERERGRYK
jgi:hypothetical protein